MSFDSAVDTASFDDVWAKRTVSLKKVVLL